MDAFPPPHSDMPAPPAAAVPTDAATRQRRLELVLEAVKAAIAAPGEHRLFRSGKLAGLFPARAGASADAALAALRDGLLETVRSEMKGKVVVEWVAATPKAVAFVHDHDSPKSVLRELKEVLQTARSGVPVWMDEARQELATLSARFEQQAAAMTQRLGELAGRVEAALRRAETTTPGETASAGRVAAWAVDALEYLDRRTTGGAAGDCPLPELFRAVHAHSPDLSVAAFHDGLRRLHDTRAVRLVPAAMMGEPEFAVVVEGRLAYAAAR